MLLFDLLTWAGVVFCLGIISFIWLKRHEIIVDIPLYDGSKWNLPIELNMNDLGYVESKIPHLREVIVVAHQLEEPQDRLLKAVKSNFSRNVIYRFIISDSSFKSESEKYIKVFEGYSNAMKPPDCPHDKLVLVHELGNEWPDVPYIFYRCWRTPRQDEEFIFSYRGSQILEGIAEHYVLMEPNLAFTIFRLVEDSVGQDALRPVDALSFQGENTIFVKLENTGS